MALLSLYNKFFQAAAELEIHPNGKWMYVSNRITGALIAFQVLDDGQLLFLQVEEGPLINGEPTVMVSDKKRDHFGLT